MGALRRLLCWNNSGVISLGLRGGARCCEAPLRSIALQYGSNGAHLAQRESERAETCPDGKPRGAVASAGVTSAGCRGASK